jgi:hypothetical protein
MTTQSYSTLQNQALTEVLAPTLDAIASPKINSITYPGDDTAASTAGGQTITINGSGFQTGAIVTVDGSTIGVVSVVDSNTITFISPAKASGSYNLYVINSDGGTGIYIPGMQYSGTPTWNTAAGSLGTLYETQTLNYTLSATSDSTITYSVGTGTLVSGGSLNSSTGAITGTAGSVSSSTTYTFGVDAIDTELQDTRRSFSVTVNPDVVTWSTPANGASYSNVVNDVFSVSLSASSAIGSPVTYSANVLPAGLSVGTANIFGTFTTAGNSSSLITATATNTSKTANITLNWAVAALPVDANYGWFASGTSSPSTSQSDRIDYSNDNVATTLRGSTINTQYMSATGNSSYGWFGNGSNTTLICRLDYSNDNAAATDRGPLSFGRYQGYATGNQNYGYFGGGGGTSTGVSVVTRITYASDLNTSETRGPLAASTYFVAATGNSDFGWWGGGANPNKLSRVSRVDYANDNTTASARGPLSSARYGIGAAGNSNYGWFAGGLGQYPTVWTYVDRITFASDTGTAATRGPISRGRRYIGATGSIDYGWFMGGVVWGPSAGTVIDRITYSSDTTTMAVRGSTADKGFRAAAGGYPG